MMLAVGNGEVNIEHENSKRPTRGFRVRRVTVTKTINKKIPAKKQSCLFCHLHQNRKISFASRQSLTSPSPQHAVYVLLISLLISLLQLDYQNKNVSPFDTHPKNMWIFFAAACIYWLGQTINVENNNRSNYSRIISHVILSSGVLASVSLASVFLPRSLGWLGLALWTILPVVLARRLIKYIYARLKNATVKIISQAVDRSHRLWGWLKLKKQQLPM